MSELLLKPINVNSFLIVVAIVAGLAIVFGVLIVLVSKLCAVKEDEKAKAIEEHLAGANCGGCGYAGCSDFAKALAEGKANVSSCCVTSNDNKAEIAKILGVPFTACSPMVAVVKCNGGDNCKNKFEYVGGDGCIAKSLFMGGNKACAYGCLGEGTCQATCPAHAIKVENGVAKVDKYLCEGCSACALKCPKSLIEMIPKTAKVYVACSSKCRGKDVMSACTKGCIGCGLCAKNCPEHAITMVDNLPVIDYGKCTGCLTCMTKCPRKCIHTL